MPKINAEDFIEDPVELKMYLHPKNPLYWEKMCGACDNFGNPETCPFYDQAEEDTEWDKPVFKQKGCNHLQRCKKFFD